jgi:hypothetical protein
VPAPTDISALLLELKEPLAVVHILQGLPSRRREESVSLEGDGRETFVTEATEVERDEGAVRFQFRWDDVERVPVDNGFKEARRTYRVRVAARQGLGKTYLFVYGDYPTALLAVPRLSEIVCGRMRQVRKVTPTDALMAWLQTSEISLVHHGNFKITQVPGTERATVSGGFDPTTHPYWSIYRHDGKLRGVHYETAGGSRICQVSPYAVYGLVGVGVTETELEQYVLGTLIPHL